MYIAVKTCWSVFYISAFSIFIFIYLLYPLLRGIYISIWGLSTFQIFASVDVTTKEK